MAGHVFISGAVEGMLDEAVLRRLVKEMGAMAGPIYGKNGKHFLLQKVNAYNQAARFVPFQNLSQPVVVSSAIAFVRPLYGEESFQNGVHQWRG